MSSADMQSSLDFSPPTKSDSIKNFEKDFEVSGHKNSKYIKIEGSERTPAKSQNDQEFERDREYKHYLLKVHEVN
jgi:hypothetical protein